MGTFRRLAALAAVLATLLVIAPRSDAQAEQLDCSITSSWSTHQVTCVRGSTAETFRCTLARSGWSWSASCTVEPAVQPTPTTSPTATVAPQPTATPVVIPTSTPMPPTPVPTATPGPGNGGFVETFDGNQGLDRFRRGVFHRDNHIVTQTSWPGDHDLNCGPPTTSRLILRSRPQDSFYVCRDHLMTAVGDTSGYSVAWFSPDQTFQSVSEVCWSVNLTDLGARQWWKVAVLSVNAPDIMSEVEASNLTGLVGPDRAVVSWGGVGGWGGPGGQMRIGNSKAQWPIFDAQTDVASRYPACFRDNGNGTVTFTMTGPIQHSGQIETHSFTQPGRFPTGPLKVVFQDHNYTPTKSDCCGDLSRGRFTWHWDSIVVRP